MERLLAAILPLLFGARPMSSTQGSDDLAKIPNLTCPGVPFEVWIEVDGKKVPYYSRELDENSKEVTCWIESEADKPFSVHYKSTTKEYAIRVRLYLDGAYTTAHTFPPEKAYRQYSTSHVRVSQNEVRRLTFGTLELTDDNSYLQDPAENFGEIRVVIERCASFKKRVSTSARHPTYSTFGTTKIHERTKKGLTHHIKQGESKQKPARHSRFVTKPGPVLTTFVFRYRPRATLQANGVIPPDPQVQGRSSSDEREVLSKRESSDDEDAAEEEERALVARLEEIRNKRQLAKESRSDTDPRKKVKLEREPPKMHFAPGEIIDLTDRDETPVIKESRTPEVLVVDLTT